jgi:hypothetical protein
MLVANALCWFCHEAAHFQIEIPKIKQWKVPKLHWNHSRESAKLIIALVKHNYIIYFHNNAARKFIALFFNRP